MKSFYISGSFIHHDVWRVVWRAPTNTPAAKTQRTSGAVVRTTASLQQGAGCDSCCGGSVPQSKTLVVVPVTDWWPEEVSCFLFKHLNLTPRACTYTHSHTYMCRHLLVFSILFQELWAVMTYLTMLSVTIVMRHQQRRWGGKHSSTPPNRDLSLAVRAQHTDQTATILTKTLCFTHVNMAQLTQMYFLLKGCM